MIDWKWPLTQDDFRRLRWRIPDGFTWRRVASILVGMTRPDTTHYSLTGVHECRYAKYRK